MRGFLQALAAWVIITTIHMAGIWFLRPSPTNGLILEILFICGSMVMGFITYRTLAGQTLALRILLTLLAAGATYAVAILLIFILLKPD
jgi:hypothetical protein